MTVSKDVLKALAKIIKDSEVMKEDDKEWPEPDVEGRQELEITYGGDQVSFATTKIGSLLDVQNSKDTEGLRNFYYLVQDLKCFAFSLITLHTKIKPIWGGCSDQSFALSASETIPLYRKYTSLGNPRISTI